MKGVALAVLLAGCTQRRDAPPPAPTPSALATSAPSVDAAAHSVDASSLAEDVDDRVREARRRYGPLVHVAVVGGVFVLVDVGSGALFARAKELLERALPALHEGKLSTRPDKAVTVYLFSNATEFLRYADAVTTRAADVPYGMYLPGPREIAVNLSLGPESFKTLTHEVVHVLMDADFLAARDWFREGLASYFEEPVFATDGSIRGAPKNWRHPRLLVALTTPADRERVRLDRAFALTGRRMREDGERVRQIHYAFVRSVCAWMDARGKLWEFYRAYRDGWHDDDSGRKAFAAVMGGTPAEKEGEWLQWVR